MPSHARARRLSAILGAVSLLVLRPGSVAADAELVRAIPGNGSTVTEPVTYVSGRYSQELTAESRLSVVDASGATVASGGIDPADSRVMVARPAAPLTSGTYSVRSTARSVDGHVTRATWGFTVDAAATPVPTPSATESAEAPSLARSATASSAGTPTRSASAPPADAASSPGDVALPIIAALAIVLIGGGMLVSRSRRPEGP